MIFPNLCIFLLFVISVINPLISDDGDFVCCHVISEMQHALETRLPFYKWRYQYLLNSRDRIAMMKVMWKLNALTRLVPYYIHISTIQIPLTLLLNCNLILPIIWMSCNCFECVVVYLKYVNIGGKSFQFSVNQKMPWIRYCLGGANFCWRSCSNIKSHKRAGFWLISQLQVTLLRQYSSLLLWSCFF